MRTHRTPPLPLLLSLLTPDPSPLPPPSSRFAPLRFILHTAVVLAAAVLAFPGLATASEPHVSNVSAHQRSDKKVEVSYDLSGAPSGGATVSIKLSQDGGASYTITPSAGTLSGDVGAGIGDGHHTIVWDAPSSLPAEFYSTQMKAAVTAEEPAGQTGDISFRLQWNGSQDLDLYVVEPSGEWIYYYNHPSSTGGDLDVDSNFPCDADNQSGTENIFWPTGQAPSGTYTYWANLYDACSGSSTVSYTLSVLEGARIVETHTGTITAVGDDGTHFSYSFQGGAGGGGGGTITITLPGGVTMELVHIPAGTFMMGSPTSERGRGDNEDLHQVTLTHGYYIGKYEVTQAQWQAVMGSNPSAFSSCGGDCPVEQVSWNDVCGGTTGSDCTSSSFIGKLNTYLGTTKFRLPTEAEWERAARAGTQTAFSFDTSSNPNWDLDCGSFPEADAHMWWCGNSGDQTHRVGSKQPNGYGLYDMHGNVWEWAADWYTSHLGTASVTNPTGPSSGSYRVVRGGSWYNDAQYCRSADRNPYSPGFAYDSLGFRLARSE